MGDRPSEAPPQVGFAASPGRHPPSARTGGEPQREAAQQVGDIPLALHRILELGDL
jgi:hypothetical protein